MSQQPMLRAGHSYTGHYGVKLTCFQHISEMRQHVPVLCFRPIASGVLNVAM